MSRNKTKRNSPRRSISVKGITYQRILNLKARNEGMTVSGYVEDLILKDLELRGEPEVFEVTDFPRYKAKKKSEDEPRAGGVNFF